ncbi:hypothetical protein A3Q56_02097 [Intoshia linei]|uniref:Uncharacterized protein n=1 Tax=Intoshia linei TaxID=1819745 RepID=A0A177B782_9BILA|nr:hypothetical protein A3Q56_02097 [Intoshia linei]
MLNKQLQGMDKTLVDAKSKIFGFVTLLYYIYLKLFDQFYYLKKCEVTDAAVLVIIDHLKLLASDLKHIEFPMAQRKDQKRKEMRPISMPVYAKFKDEEDQYDDKNSKKVKFLMPNIKVAISTRKNPKSIRADLRKKRQTADVASFNFMKSNDPQHYHCFAYRRNQCERLSLSERPLSTVELSAIADYPSKHIDRPPTPPPISSNAYASNNLHFYIQAFGSNEPITEND